MGELKTTDKYALAQILVSGAVTSDEFKSANSFLGEVQEDSLARLQRFGYLQHTLYEGY